MTKEEIRTRYQDHIIPESKHPFHFEVPEEFEKDILAYNPLCGDKYHLYTSKDSIYFHGIGCALSQASASLLAKAAEGKERSAVEKLVDDLLKSLEIENEISDELPESIKVLASLKHFEGRIDCIRLPWKTVQEELKKDR